MIFTKKHISFSEFVQYSECGHKSLILKQLKLAVDPPSIHLFFGSAIHKAIELHVKESYTVDKMVATFTHDFRSEMVNNLMTDPSFSETESFIAQGENIIRTLDLYGIFRDYDVISVEEPLYELIHGAYHFKGFIDIILRHKKTGRYLIGDWKTSGEAWDLAKKLKDDIFLCQMRFYKFFYGRKHRISLDQIDCRYFVLNRLKNKKNHMEGFGETQIVDVQSTEEEIQASLLKLTEAIKGIHIQQSFPKIKFTNKGGCFFCKFKGGRHELCNADADQDQQLLKQYTK